MNVSVLLIFVSCLISYLVGSIPAGYLFAKYFFNLDITKLGSGNTGATNVARVFGKKYFILIFITDFLKAFLMLYLIFQFFSRSDFDLNFIIIVNSIVLLLGNAYSIFLNFNGGKGVSTVIGIFTYLFSFKLILIFAGVWVIVLSLFRKPFLASILATYLFCFVYYFSLGYKLSLFCFLIFTCLWVTFRHRKNIREFL